MRSDVKRRPKTDEERVRERFPTARARIAADEAIDALDERAPMTAYIDTWLAAYKAAGGVDLCSR